MDTKTFLLPKQEMDMNLVEAETETFKCKIEETCYSTQPQPEQTKEEVEEPLEFKDTPDELDFRCETINKILSPTHLVKIESELDPIETTHLQDDSHSYNK